jgi:hypothetical protein
VTDQPRYPQSCPPARHPRPPLPAARRALTVLGALLLSLAAAATAAPAASATPAPPEPPPGPPPLPTVTAPGLPLWAVLVILGGTIALSAATTLITLALQPAATSRRPQPPARRTAAPRTMHQPHSQPGPPRTPCLAPGHAPADPFADPPDTPRSPSAARARGQLPLDPHPRRSS